MRAHFVFIKKLINKYQVQSGESKLVTKSLLPRERKRFLVGNDVR